MTTHRLLFAGMTAGLTTFAFSALAQQSAGGDGTGYGYHPHMWNNGGWGDGAWGGGLLHGPLVVIVTIVVLALVVMGIARMMGCTGGRHRCGHNRGSSSALMILEERFAKGEIDKAEFEERRSTLKP